MSVVRENGREASKIRIHVRQVQDGDAFRTKVIEVNPRKQGGESTIRQAIWCQVGELPSTDPATEADELGVYLPKIQNLRTECMISNGELVFAPPFAPL